MGKSLVLFFIDSSGVVGWLHNEMVYGPEVSHPSKY